MLLLAVSPRTWFEESFSYGRFIYFNRVHDDSLEAVSLVFYIKEEDFKAEKERALGLFKAVGPYFPANHEACQFILHAASEAAFGIFSSLISGYSAVESKRIRS
ncbi:hypothetical protein SLEP1_g57095 [Rubroshorea leprosula]|uniref:Uncharacterized protein n=1 Tax=Rubroshorea leprosula TaxID=152421 RepID=A0AAV5MLI1_9ROSI|nr:hypothetical protein SLEP1_g57095 [Rubroshorea leprosula]